MRGLKIYIPSTSKNAFFSELITALKETPGIEEVYHGVEDINTDELDVDIVLFQWPEILTKWKLPESEDITYWSDRIHTWKKKGVKIMATVHNSLPHRGTNENTRRLYELVYNNCDRIIHLGEASKRILKEKINYNIPSEYEIVIPHGNYSIIPNSFSKVEAREKLGLKQKAFVVGILGNLRNQEEVSILKIVATYLKRRRGTLLVAGKVAHRSKKTFSYYKMRFPLWLARNVLLKEGFVPHEELQFYLNAADVIFIPRLQNLNSGNVALGFTFGKIVVGPDYGVIGEELKKNKNPTYNLNQSGSIETALGIAEDLMKGNRGQLNREYAYEELNWKKIAESYVRLFKEVMKL